MSENKIKTKLYIPYLFSLILSLTSYLIYTLIPVSNLANSVEHSGMDAVYVLTVSPIAGLLSLVLFVVSYILNKNHLNSLLSKPLTIGAYAVITVMILISTVFSVMFVVSMYQLGFTAPINGTKWQSYSIFMLVSLIMQLVSFILLILADKGIILKK